MSKNKSASEIVRERAKNPRRLEQLLTEAQLEGDIAQAIYDARKKAGLSQSELARRVGTHQSAISRLESADYNGHSIAMLQKIAAALGGRIKVRFVLEENKKEAA